MRKYVWRYGFDLGNGEFIEHGYAYTKKDAEAAAQELSEQYGGEPATVRKTEYVNLKCEELCCPAWWH